MSDKITSLQDQLSLISRIMVDSLGVLQRDAPPSITDYQLRKGLPMVSDNTKAVWTQEQLRENSESAGKNLVSACLEFERMLDELPTLIQSEEDQTNRLKDFQSQNENQTHLLKQKIDLAEDYLKTVSNSIEDITNNRLQVRHQSKKLQ